MKVHFPTRIAALVASVGPVAGPDACSSNDDSATSAGRSGDTIKVVTSTKVRANVANIVTDGKKVSIDPIIASNGTDPHSYKPAIADVTEAEDADILIVDGEHYDVWLTSSLRGAKDKVVISAPPQEEGHEHDHDREGHDDRESHDDYEDHEHDHGHESHDDHEGHEGHEYHHHNGEANGHVWYDTDTVEETIEQLADVLAKLGAKADAKVVDKKTKDIEEVESRLRAAKVARVHPLVNDILEDMRAEDITPKGYHQSTLNESEPPASGANGILRLIESGGSNYLIGTSQAHDQVSQCLVEAAEARGVEIVDISRSPSINQLFFDLYK